VGSTPIPSTNTQEESGPNTFGQVVGSTPIPSTNTQEESGPNTFGQVVGSTPTPSTNTQEESGPNTFGQVVGSNPTPATAHFVYILQSKSTGRFYIGHTDHLIRRFNQHQSGYSVATRGKGPWWMPYYEVLESKSQAVQRERAIKAKKNRGYIRLLINTAYPELALH